MIEQSIVILVASSGLVEFATVSIVRANSAEEAEDIEHVFCRTIALKRGSWKREHCKEAGGSGCCGRQYLIIGCGNPALGQRV